MRSEPRRSDFTSEVGAPTPDISGRGVGAQYKPMAYVYILESITDGRYYIGSTVDLDKRLYHHIGGHTPTTKRFGKVKLVFKQEYDSLKDARIIEKKLKKLRRKNYLRKIINEGFIKMRS